MCQLGSVRQSGLDVLRLQCRIAAQDFRLRCAFRQAIQYVGNQHTGTRGAQLPGADIGVGAEEIAPIGHICNVNKWPQ